MGRLTEKDDQGNWSLKGVRWEQLHVGQPITEEIWQKLYGALWKLMEYEDSDLPPDQIWILNDLYLEKCQEVNQLKAQIPVWIPVEERNPANNDYECYICTLDGDLCNQENEFTGMCGFENGKWDEPGYVIAWMPLPEPYRTEEVE